MAFVIQQLGANEYRSQQAPYPGLHGLSGLGALSAVVPCTEDPTQPHCAPIKDVGGGTTSRPPPPSITVKGGAGDKLFGMDKRTVLLIGGGVLVAGVLVAIVVL